MSDLPNVSPLLDELAQRLQAELAKDDKDPLLAGIHTGGVWIAEALRQRLQNPPPLGTLDVSYYRDDLARGGLHPRLHPTHLPDGVDGRTIWLIDDVLHTGRTVRAAINEVFDFGRPARVRLLVLIVRAGHELPIAADLAGARIDDLTENVRIRLLGPDPLQLEVTSAKKSAAREGMT